MSERSEVELQSLQRRMRNAALLLVALIAVGVFGYKLLGGAEHTWIEAVYMVTIMLTTTGLRAEVPRRGRPHERVAALHGAAQRDHQLGTRPLRYLFTVPCLAQRVDSFVGCQHDVARIGGECFLAQRAAGPVVRRWLSRRAVHFAQDCDGARNGATTP